MYFWDTTLHVSDIFSVHHQESRNVLLCVQYWTLDDGQKTCPKHVQFYSKNKFEKLVHPVGFIISKLATIQTYYG